MADTNLEQTIFEYSPITPVRFIHKPNKYVLKAEEFNNYMHGLTTACGSYYTCIKELQQKFDSLTATGVANNSITTAHLQKEIITSEKIALKSIEDKHIAPNTISHNKISAGAFYQLLRKTYGAVDRNSAPAVQEMVIEHPANQDIIKGQYEIDGSQNAHGIVLGGALQYTSIGNNYHVLFDDGFRISLTNPFDQGWYDGTTNTRHVLSTASFSSNTVGLTAVLLRNEKGNLVLDYVFDFWYTHGPAYVGTYVLHYALF